MLCVAYHLVNWDSTNCGPLHWLVFMRRNESNFGLPFGGLLSPCIFVFIHRLTFGRFTLILWIARSIGAAPLFFYHTEAPWARDSPSSALPVPHRMSSKQRLFFLVPWTIVFSFLCVYVRS